MTKVYAYPGITSGEILIQAGKAYVRVEFTKGYIDKKLNRPATLITDDKTLQGMIENSDLFNKRIFLYKVYGADAEGSTVDVEYISDNDNSGIGAKESLTVREDVRNVEDAVKILKAIPGVKASGLRSLPGIQRTAAKNGISFPNLVM